MGILTSSGSAASTSLPAKNDYVDDSVSTQPSPEQTNLDSRYIHDTFVNKTAINLDRFGGVIKALEGYAEGTPIRVTYFHNQYTATDERTNDSDFAKALNPVNTDLLQINDFEFRLKDPFDYSFDNGELVSAVRGTGVVYPGFVPVVGDFFIYELEPGYLGLFKVDTQPSRLSIRTGTFHEMAFILDRFVDSNDISQIKLRVSDEAWFDKQRFLTGEASLLLYDDYAAIKSCEKWTTILLDYYVDTFWDNIDHYTFLRPDGAYDPYIIDFIRKVFNVDEIKRHPSQLLPRHTNHDWTIFEKLLAPKNIPWELMKNKYTINDHKVSMWDVRINSLINKQYITVVEEDEVTGTLPDYVVDDVSGMGVSGYDDYHKLLCAYLNNEVINAKLLLTCVENYLYVSKDEQFYRIPILLFLLKKLRLGLKTGTSRFTHDTSAELPVELDFTAANLTSNKITVTSLDDQKIVGIYDELGGKWYPKPGYVYYNTDSAVVDISDILTQRNITTITGTWKVVVSKGGAIIQ